MATLYVTEYQGTGKGTGGAVQVANEPRLVNQAVTFSTHAESSAFNANTFMVRLHTDAICSFTFGVTPVATTAMSRMVAGQTEYFFVNPGDKVSVVANT